ncbi:hypothetical protein, partial [Staphylococcus capitis]|uniref:hypothetical protein n=1 Tax=Staphylococcus capitis TaxID=29388 RepID=UPI001C92C94A
QLNKQHQQLKQQPINLNQTIQNNQTHLQLSHQHILPIQNHYQHIKPKQSKLHLLINHAIHHLNHVYHLTVHTP